MAQNVSYKKVIALSGCNYELTSIIQNTSWYHNLGSVTRESAAVNCNPNTLCSDSLIYQIIKMRLENQLLIASSLCVCYEPMLLAYATNATETASIIDGIWTPNTSPFATKLSTDPDNTTKVN